MKKRHLLAALSATSLVATPVLAAPAQPAPVSSASKLSLSSAPRAAAATNGERKLGGPGAIIGLIGFAAVIAGGVSLALDDDDSDSN